LSARMSVTRRLARLAFPVALLGVSVLAFIDPGDQPLPGIDDSLQHAVAFFSLAVLALLGWPHRTLRSIACGLLLYGLWIEAVQWFLPWRECSLLDWLADGAGLLPALLLARAMAALRGEPEAAQ